MLPPQRIGDLHGPPCYPSVLLISDVQPGKPSDDTPRPSRLSRLSIRVRIPPRVKSSSLVFTAPNAHVRRTAERMDQLVHAFMFSPWMLLSNTVHAAATWLSAMRRYGEAQVCDVIIIRRANDDSVHVMSVRLFGSKKMSGRRKRSESVALCVTERRLWCWETRLRVLKSRESAWLEVQWEGWKGGGGDQPRLFDALEESCEVVDREWKGSRHCEGCQWKQRYCSP